MKLALREEDGFSILDVDGSVGAHEVSVLKAGLTRLLQRGKNRIILHLLGTQELPREVIWEIAVLDVLARELSGRILIASNNPDLKEQVKAFAKPPVIPILDSVKKAMELSKDLDLLEGEESGESAAELAKKLEEKEHEVGALKAQLKLADTRDLSNLRAQNAELKGKVQLLEDQVETLLRERVQPVLAEGEAEKIRVLEDTVKRMTEARAQETRK
jgi:hypothetical protein